MGGGFPKHMWPTSLARADLDPGQPGQTGAELALCRERGCSSVCACGQLKERLPRMAVVRTSPRTDPGEASVPPRTPDLPLVGSAFFRMTALLTSATLRL